VLVLSEIWSNNVTMFNNLISGYNFYYDLPVAGNVGGVAMGYMLEVIYRIILLIIIELLTVKIVKLKTYGLR